MHILNIIIRHHFNAISLITHQQLIIYDYDCVSVLRVDYFKLQCSSETIIISLNGPSFPQNVPCLSRIVSKTISS